MIDNLLQMYDEQRYRFHHDEEVHIVVKDLDALVDRIRKLESELEVCREKEQLEWERSRDERL